ncbi:TetR/AcrR family transcriptional regulator [Paenibacillus eucommiae]|uniref:AcrR family transcriptional regulator n=1 Tax=Paenibacillus eucommiae TaxID=1355755 RepID=A0ABS4IZ38_9BACL|nr:TetR/AcrR family transcriptional regulator [Paenibacillus eucommiae]MBP1992858.1 AcrR family transcriptional regulator [Paenibacillus eucommiae]
MTAKKIRDVALKHFANHGYEGASLADIAADVGIKTPSIYAHYKGKDELFLTVVEYISACEERFIIDLFEQLREQPLEHRLHTFLISYQERYEQDLQTKLWLRVSFFPPPHLYEQVISQSYSLLDKMEQLFIPLFERAIEEGIIHPVGAERAVVAYMALTDSVLVEMLYGGPERTAKRLEASWWLYWRGLTLAD